jgi:thiol:disulfide interchange protein DsbD
MTTPLKGMTAGRSAVDEVHGLAFRRVKTVGDLDRALAEATGADRPAKLDFNADWCVSCIEMEKYTLTDPGVQGALADTLLLNADVTANDAEDQALLARFGVFGPPTIIFFGRDGRQQQGFEVVGYMKARDFAAHVQRAVGRESLTASAANDRRDPQ